MRLNFCSILVAIAGLGGYRAFLRLSEWLNTVKPFRRITASVNAFQFLWIL